MYLLFTTLFALSYNDDPMIKGMIKFLNFI